MTEEIAAAELLERYSAVLLDAYGVLVTSGGPVHGAADFLSEVRRRDMPFAVVTNDASRLPETSREAYASRGIEIEAERIVTSGQLLDGWFEKHGLHGVEAVVLGPPDSHEYVRRAGGVAVEWNVEAPVVVIGDEAGFPFLPAFDAVLSMIVARVRAGREVAMVCPNPDRVYPKGGGEYGVASGGIAAMFESALEALLGPDAPTIERLGKPHPAMFETALARVGTRDCVMFGDQLETDILGAQRAGIDAAFVATGVGATVPDSTPARPRWLVRSLAMR